MLRLCKALRSAPAAGRMHGSCLIEQWMFALPPDLSPGTGDQVSGVTCPTCHGSLRVRAEGKGHLHFTCRVGHAFSLKEALEAQEQFFEDTVWAAIRAAEELEQLLADVIDYRRDGNDAGPEATYAQRRQRAHQDAAGLRRVLDGDQPITFTEDTPVDAGGHDP